MNILKKIIIIKLILASLFISSCSKDLHFSGVSENSVNQLLDNYLTEELSKEDVIKLIGSPLVTENSNDLWIYRIEKEQGNATFKKSIYNKTLKLNFENGVLRSVEEININ